MPQIDVERLEEYADVIFNRANYFNDYTLETIGRRIKEIGSLSAADQQALKNMADISGDMESITKKLAEITEQNISDIEKIYAQVVTEGVNSYKPLYDFRNMSFIPFEENEYAQFLVKHWAKETSGNILNLSRTKALCFVEYDLSGNVIGTIPLQGTFQKAIDDAVIAISSGTTDYNTAMRKTIEHLGGSGIRVNYGGGVSRRLDSMVRQNLLYGAKRAAQAYDEYIGDKLGCDGFEVDYHPGARLAHEFMGGNMYSYSGDVTVGGKHYKDGAEALKRLTDYGCLHFKTDVILGVSEPRYEKEWLKKQKSKDKKLIEYNGSKKTLYEWKQAQRRLELKAREQYGISNMAKSAGNNDLMKIADKSVQAIRRRYDDLCSKTGLQPTLERMAAFNKKPLTKGGDGGTMKAEPASRYVNTSDVLFKNAGKIKPIEGFEDITIHGDKYGFEIRSIDGKTAETYSVREFAEILREDPNYSGGDIRLISCETGADGATAAQLLANQLGVNVMAPSDVVWVFPDGSITIGPNEFENTGEWRMFKPKGV